MAQSNQELVVQIKADLSKLQKGLDGAEQKAKGFKNRLAKIGDSLKQALNFGAIFAGGAAVANAFNVIKDFEQATANLAAVTGQSVSDVNNLKNAALDLGAKTAFTAKQVTGLQTELAKLGFREKDILNLTKPILNLAQATGTDLANAAALAGSVVQSFGLDASQTTSVVDIMTKSFSASALDIGKFEVGIRQVAPVAKNANVSLSKVTSMLGILANNGVRAETAGVGLRNILLEAAKRGKPFKELLEDVNTASDKSAKAMELFGKENAAVGVILAETTTKADELNTALESSAGTAQKMADTQLNTLTGQFTLLTSAWDGFVLGLDSGQGTVSHVLGRIVGGATKILNAFTKEVDNSALSLESQRSEFIKQMTVLEQSNLSQEAKRDLIGQINDKYADYLPNLITEKTTLGELKTITKQVNDQFTKRIVLQAQEAKLAEQIQAITAAKSDLIRSEIRLEEIRLEKITANELELAKLNREEVSLAGIIAYSNKVLKDNETELSKLLDIQKQVREDLNILNDVKEDETDLIIENTNELDKNTKAKKKNAAADKIRYEDPGGMFEIDTENLYDDVITDDMKKLDEQLDRTAQKSQLLAGAMQTSFSAISSAIMGTVSEADTAMGRFVRALAANAIEIIGINLSQSIANAITGATQSGTATGPAAAFTTPAFIASAIGGIIGAFAAIPKFATGGIVNGSSFSGDRVMARVNSGEMILNRSQQANLFGMINRGGGGNERLVTQIAGNDLRVVLERAQRTNNRLR